MSIYKENHSIIFETDYSKIEISDSDAAVRSVFDKINSKEIKGKKAYFFHLILNDKETVILPESISLKGNVVSVFTGLGSFDIKIKCESEYIAFEIISSLPKEAWKCCIANACYSYDYTDKSSCGAIGIAVTYWANPCFFPDSKSMETKAEISPHLKDVGAAYALIIAPINKHRDIIKKVSLTISKNTGIMSKHGGAWGQDSPLNYENTVLVGQNSEEFVKGKSDYYKLLGLSHIDFHKGKDSFCQGDFKYVHFNDSEDFKNRVTKYLEENNMYAGLHTYTAYIDYDCDSILSDPKWQKQLSFIGEYTLSKDTDETALFLPTVESTDSISKDYTFFSRNTPYILAGTEIMEFENASGGFKIKQRAIGTTENKAYKKGTIAFVMKSGIPDKAGLLKYYLDTDFEGKRDFILLESDNGMRPDLLFDGDVYTPGESALKYADYREEYTHDKVGGIAVMTCGDVSEVKISDIIAVEHSYETICNPSVQIGECTITFCTELRSTQYIEYDGISAKVTDKYGNEEPIKWIGDLCAPEGNFEAKLTSENTAENPLRAQLTLGFEGKTII